MEEFEVTEGDAAAKKADVAAPAAPPGLEDEEVGRAYMSVSQAAHERKPEPAPTAGALVPTKSIQ